MVGLAGHLISINATKELSSMFKNIEINVNNLKLKDKQKIQAVIFESIENKYPVLFDYIIKNPSALHISSIKNNFNPKDTDVYLTALYIHVKCYNFIKKEYPYVFV